TGWCVCYSGMAIGYSNTRLLKRHCVLTFNGALKSAIIAALFNAFAVLSKGGAEFLCLLSMKSGSYRMVMWFYYALMMRARCWCYFVFLPNSLYFSETGALK